MKKFSNRVDLCEAWVEDYAFKTYTKESSYEEQKKLAEIIVRNKLIYTPHIYRGGYVIRGFGYSTERIGIYISKKNAGSPKLV